MYFICHGFSQGSNDLITITIENNDLAGFRWLLEYCALPIEGHFCGGCGEEHVRIGYVLGMLTWFNDVIFVYLFVVYVYLGCKVSANLDSL